MQAKSQLEFYGDYSSAPSEHFHNRAEDDFLSNFRRREPHSCQRRQSDRCGVFQAMRGIVFGFDAFHYADAAAIVFFVISVE